MSNFPIGCYVLHTKLAELGSGEVMMVDKGAIRIRFASGERSFLATHVDPHLQLTAAAPVIPTASGTRKRAAKKSAVKSK